MPFLGVQPTDTFASVAKQTITGDGSVTYTLTHSVANANDLAVFVNNVRQEPTVAYSASGTSITFTEAIDSTDDCYVVYIARTFQSVTAPDNSINADQLSYPLTNFSSTGIDDNATSTTITIDSNENVGIGTTSPNSYLQYNGLTINGGTQGSFVDFENDGTLVGEIFTESVSGVSTFIIDTVGATTDIEFRTDATERMRIDSSGNVGIGVSDPDAHLEVAGSIKQSGTHAYPIKIDSDTFVYYPHYNTAHVAYYKRSIHPANSNEYHYYWRTSDTGAPGGANETTLMTLNTGSTHGGKLYLSGGVSFASNFASANTLDDYEEGTWTPTYTTSNSNGSVTYNVQSGHYTKIGRCVFVTMYMQVSSVSSIGTGNPRFSGLPFTGTGSNERLAIQTYLVDWDSATWPSDPMAYISNGQSYFRVILWRDNGTWTEPQASQFAVDTANAVVNISGFYFTNQ